MKVALFCRPHQVPGDDLRACIEVAKVADRAGLHSIHFGEHHLVSARIDRYPYGEFVHGRETPWLEPITTLGAMAAVTGRLRLSTGVLLAPLRPAPLLAKSVATLDVLSGGRVELGVGTGWQREEYEAIGLPWSERYERLDDTLAACRALWGEQPASYEGRWCRFADIHALPRPVQDRIPILYGTAMNERTAARVAVLGDGWCPVGLSFEELRAGIDCLRGAFEAAGRDPAALIVRNRPPQPLDRTGRIDVDRTFEAAALEVAAGVTIVAVGPPVGVDSQAAVTEFVDAVAEAGRAHDPGT